MILVLRFVVIVTITLKPSTQRKQRNIQFTFANMDDDTMAIKSLATDLQKF